MPTSPFSLRLKGNKVGSANQPENDQGDEIYEGKKKKKRKEKNNALQLEDILNKSLEERAVEIRAIAEEICYGMITVVRELASKRATCFWREKSFNNTNQRGRN